MARRELPPAAVLSEAIERAVGERRDLASLKAALQRVTAAQLVADLQDSVLADMTLLAAGQFLGADVEGREIWRPVVEALGAALWREHRRRRKLSLGQFSTQSRLSLGGGRSAGCA